MRPNKKGLDYFPLDVDIDSDDKAYYIQSRFGLEGFALLVKVLCKIYRDGYYTNFTEKDRCIFAAKSGVTADKISQFTDACVEVALFDKDIYQKYQVLTSKGIQKRYVAACRRRITVDISPDFCLIDLQPHPPPSSTAPVSLDSSPLKNENNAMITPPAHSFYNRIVQALDKCDIMKIEPRILAIIIPAWEKLYSNIDVEREILRAEEWLVKKNKRKKRYDLYLSNWFSQSVVYSRKNKNTTVPPEKYIDVED